MIDQRCSQGHSLVDLIDYWAGDLDREQAGRIEERIFGCTECGERLADIEGMSRAIFQVVRAGRFHSVLTEAMLNRLSRDGVRIRTYTLQPGATIPCAIWADDELVVSRLRADFAGFEHVVVALQLETGEELSRVVDIPIVPGQTELLDGVSANRLRALPPTRLRIVLSGTRAGREEIIGEFGLKHEGVNVRPRTGDDL